MAVLPDDQRQGIGAALIREGLQQCRAGGCEVVVVLGHREYYPRFGFIPASRKGLRCEFPVPDEAFMVVELAENALRGRKGLVKYHRAFSEV
jgi:putative acetyltransferase